MTAPVNISGIAERIFGTATCQRDLDARVGDFVAALHAAGYETPQVGSVAWNPALQGLARIEIANWSFKWTR